jgi:hypothetical protein
MAFDRRRHLLDVFASDTLPSDINLGLYVLIDGIWLHCNDSNYSKLSGDQFLQLVSKLPAHPHVKILNLGAACVGNTPGLFMCQQLAGAFKRPVDLSVLQLGGVAHLTM